jgi:iron complex transport system ATP-binding protein
MRPYSGSLAMGSSMMASNSPLSAQNLTCGFPDRTVLSSVNVSFERGAATAVLGPNGSGKSTLLRSLTGELPPRGGKVELFGKDISTLSIADLAGHVAVVPQQEHIPFRFSTWEVAMMGRLARSKGIADSEEDRVAVRKALEFTDSLEFADRPINELSGGEKQRVLLARALAQETEIVILDEPTTHLDITHQIDLCRLVRQMIQDGKTVVAAMHDLNLVGSMATRAILLGSGIVKLDASTEEVLSSTELDEVYSVAFRKTKDGGKTLVLPPLIG